MRAAVLRPMYSLDERGSYRQQRKRRAGISGGSVAALPRSGGPLAFAGGDSGCSSAGVATGGRGPTLGGRSPQSSFDSNTDVAQISMNWMRMNGLGQGSFRPLLTGNPAVAKSTTNLGRVSSLRKMHAISSLEDRVPPHRYDTFDGSQQEGVAAR
ncbi:hypothetical protein Y032_0077g1131 [Ancylostoma ceylanicum]|uniref:Uncharacterized protein n=1 Tax=Ancylostoma ceylanicum TaxID=53326 RepID=A0A016TU60_9BILA|nr:hypothetical protein Y032_0077g1131 [Ancylostoma ceylanicum]